MGCGIARLGQRGLKPPQILVIDIYICEYMTQCKIEFTYAPHCVSKNVTPRRMLKKCF